MHRPATIVIASHQSQGSHKTGNLQRFSSLGKLDKFVVKMRLKMFILETVSFEKWISAMSADF